MLKKAAVAGFGLILAMSLAAPRKAAAQVHVGVGVSIGTPDVYGAVVVQPAPVVVQPAPVVVAPPPTVVVYDDAFFVAHPWTYGFHGGWYYEGGTRYWIDRDHHRHYDERYRDARYTWAGHRHDNGWHGEHPRGHDNWRGGHDNGWHGDHGRGHDEHWHADRGHDNGWHGGHGHGHDD
jgi:hypothetical protein